MAEASDLDDRTLLEILQLFGDLQQGDSRAEPEEPKRRLLVAAIDFGTTFSGYAFSFTSSKDEIFMNKNWGSESGFQLHKTETSVLLNPNREFVAFGSEASKAYTELDESDAKKHYYFHRFKMKLHTEKTLSQDTTVEDVNGKKLPALDIFAHAIRYLKDHMLEAIKLTVSADDVTLRNDDIRWVLTVPAIWDDRAKQFMRQAAYKAGIASDSNEGQLMIALEPEAAGIFCRCDKTQQKFVDIKPGDRYMIVDCGGGTVDITVYETGEDCKVKEVTTASGGDWGGTKVDEEFLKLLDDIFEGCGLAIVKGAVMFGHNPSSIAARKSKYTYGTGVCVPFDPEHHPDRLKERIDGQLVAVGEVSEHVFSPASMFQPAMGIEIFRTEEQEVHYCDDEGVTSCGHVIVALPPPIPGLTRAVRATLTFAETEIKVDAFAVGSDDIIVNKNWGANAGFQSYKSPTSVLLSPVGELWLSVLKQDLDRSVYLTAKNGRTLPAVDVFSHALRYLKQHMMDAIAEVSQSMQIREEDIRWVITVPAIWNDAAKQFMREAAYDADIVSRANPQQLVIALEPESASLFCRELPVNQFAGERGGDGSDMLNMAPGTRYMVVDCGGGTVDITVHEVRPDNRVKEVYAATGGAWGGTQVDEQFVALTEEVFDKSFIDDYRSSYPSEWQQWIDSFETKKRSTNSESGSVNFPIHYHFNDFHKREKGGDVKECVDNCGVEGGGEMRELFKDVIDDILDHVETLMNKERTAKKHIFYPSHPDQTKAAINVYGSYDKDVHVTSAPGVEKLGYTALDMPDTTGGVGRQIEITFYFGDTEIEVDAVDVTTGSKANVEVNFLDDDIRL
ncbi:hypothetical protein Bbelb_117850 [Branchiostoma belcheri]|nr:hypothetical protein Bbelb_117850 [Branchiostoma belcheri]